MKFHTEQFEDREDQHWIVVDEGPLAGVKYTYGPILFNGEDEEGNGKISYTYVLNPDTPVKDEHLGLLEETMGEILNQIMLQVAEGSAKLTEEEEAVEILESVD